MKNTRTLVLSDCLWPAPVELAVKGSRPLALMQVPGPAPALLPGKHGRWMQAELQKTSVKPAKRPMFHTKVLPPTRVSSSCISEQRQRARFPPDTQPLLILFSPASHCCLGGFNTWLKLTYRFKDQRTLTDFFHHLNFFQTRKKVYPSKKYFLPGEFSPAL